MSEEKASPEGEVEKRVQNGSNIEESIENTVTKVQEELLHPVKNVPFFLNDTHICLQNENGPCPLLCLVNILFLRETIAFPNHYITPGVVPANRLVEIVANHLLETFSEKATTGCTFTKDVGRCY